jgi:hypothetical protein
MIVYMRLEPYEGKLSRTVLRREGRSNPPDLADLRNYGIRVGVKVTVGMKRSGGSGIARSAGPGGDGVRTMERGGAAGVWSVNSKRTRMLFVGAPPF